MAHTLKKPELLAPAGNLEKLTIAYKAGADACYIGGTVFGLRKYADNFDARDLKKAITLANSLNKQLYIVLNGYAHNTDIEALIPHLKDLEKLQPHAFIISDMGVLQVAKEHTTIPIHVSTQASITNYLGCKFWQQAGAKRIILAREVPIEDCIEIKKHLDIELEVFVHGAQCASYSGKCVISNYTSGRDSNRGGCIQSCRHHYDVFDPKQDPNSDQPEFSTHIMNAKDQQGIYQLETIIKAGIESIKVEGRMKSNHYVANTIATYRQAIDTIHSRLINHEKHDPNHDNNHNHDLNTTIMNNDELNSYSDTLNQVSNRTFSSGGLVKTQGAESIHYDFAGYQKGVTYVGTVKAAYPNKGILVHIQSPIEKGDTLTLQKPDGTKTTFQVSQLHNLNQEPIEKVNPNSSALLPWIENSSPLDLIIKPL